MLKLRSTYTNAPTKKKNCKQSLFNPNYPSNLKMVFILLTKLVAVFVQFSIIHIRHLSFKQLFILCWKPAKFLVRLQVSLHELLE